MPDKAIFLDRDDTIIEDTGYISTPEQVKLIPAAAQALVELRKLGYKLIVVSNQSGIARGLLTEQTLSQIHERLKQLLAEHNAYLDRIYYCPYLPDGAVSKYRKDSDWRKPKPGMLLAAAREMKINLAESWMIGNSYIDVAAGKAAGCRTVLIKSNIKPPVKNQDDPDPDFEAINMREAVNVVKRELYRKPAPPPQTEPQTEPEQIKQEQKPQIPNEEIPTEPPQEPKTVVQPVSEQSKTEQLLEEIKLLLKSHHRTQQFEEFSAMKLFAGILQLFVLFCLVVAIWYKLSPTGKDNAVFTAIGFAITLQLIALTLYVMHKDR
ncbi:MAG: HAD-IIIA family hydrolase [Phycisphaerae bacterium]|nr:HAD-IIIA family hydrolase [Phycisphaerae bacterium]